MLTYFDSVCNENAKCVSLHHKKFYRRLILDFTVHDIVDGEVSLSEISTSKTSPELSLGILKKSSFAKLSCEEVNHE